MKLSIAVLGLFTALTTALPKAFTLVADGGNTVLTDGEKLVYGGDPNAYEILILHGTGTNATSGLSFTSKKSTPTGFQDLYVLENSVSPVALTMPHSASVPEGASTTGFSSNAQGYLTHNGKNYFGVEGYGDNPEKTVNWVGGHSSTQRVANLWVKECRGC